MERGELGSRSLEDASHINRAFQHIQDQHNSGNARVHNGNVFNYYTGDIVLPEHVAPEAIRLSNRLDEAERASSSIANLIANSQTAPLRLYVIARELDDIAHILQVFRSQFMNEDRLGDLLWASNIEGIEEVLDRCMSGFENIQSRIESVSGVLTSGDNVNTSEPDGFSKRNVAALRDELNSYKVKFSLVIALVNMLESRNASSMAKEAFDDLHSRFEMAINAIENEKAGIIPAKPHTDLDRAVVRFDPGYQMRHYIDSSCSLLSEAISCPAPSMQVSSYLESTIHTSDSFVTARTELEQRDYPHIRVKGLPNIAVLFLPFHGSRTVKDIQRMIAARIALPESSLRLSYGDTILNDVEATLESLDISQGTTLFCQLPVAEALSTYVSQRGIEPFDDGATEYLAFFEAVERLMMGDSWWATHFSPLPTERPRLLSLNPWRSRFGSSVTELVLVLDLSRHTLQVCGSEDIEGAQETHLQQIRLPTAGLSTDILHLYMETNCMSRGLQNKPCVFAAKRRFHQPLSAGYEYLCTLRIDNLGLAIRLRRILGQLNVLHIIRSLPRSDETEKHDYQIHFSSKSVRSIPERQKDTRS
ncbi:hypothetical protein NA56DRAFT_688077 [Hyaloscypha hepaticicola]|uniref:Ubiquitin-like domain-containing protein n=1 Tax=Hyaloscypha hepaticicola TaxID=2082293 RepID=A0A2J6Q858_9HELO|nr:hypothetical protein NA56DRAFT_688077 [Hyaloscypha hepaticicola]